MYIFCISENPIYRALRGVSDWAHVAVICRFSEEIIGPRNAYVVHIVIYIYSIYLGAL